MRDQGRGSKPYPAGKPVGLGDEHRAQFEPRAADRKSVPDGEAEPSKECGVRHDPVGAAAPRQCIGERQRRIEDGFARQGIGFIDRLDLDQSRLAVLAPRHGAQQRHRREASLLPKKIALGGGQFALGKIEGGVAAEDRAALLGKPVLKRKRHRANAGNRGDAERDGREKDREPTQAAAKIAQGKAQDQGPAQTF